MLQQRCCQLRAVAGVALPRRAVLSGRYTSSIPTCSAFPSTSVASTSSSNGNGSGNGSGALVADRPTATPPVSTPPAAPVTIIGVSPPAGAYAKVVELGASKAALPAWKVVVLGMLAGAYISFGALLMLSVGANVPQMSAQNPGLAKMLAGAFGLPTGVLLNLVCGGELFMGNTALVAAAMAEGKATMRQLVRNWTASFVGNLIGCTAMVALVAATGLFAVGTSSPVQAAVSKTSLTFMQAFTRGILCNWLVCLAVWQATAANTLGGKAIGVWLPISTFVAIGLESSVANMFIIPLGIALGAPISYGKFVVANLVPVTLGNALSGVLMVALAYALCFGSLGKLKKAA